MKRRKHLWDLKNENKLKRLCSFIKNGLTASTQTMYYRLDSQQPQGTDLSMQVETITYKNLSHHQNESLDWEVWRFTTVMFHHAHYIHID